MAATGTVLGEQPGGIDSLEWHFSQVFGERAPSEDIQEGMV